MCLERERTLKPVIELSGVKKSFPAGNTTKQILDGIDLSIYENEFVVICGPGQCGKTTLINIIAGLDRCDEGRVIVNGREVKEPSPERGVVYQNIMLFDWLTVMGNVEFGPKAMGENKAERQKRAKYFIDMVGLTGFENTYPVKLSGGMKQRVGIARAYCINPAVLLMDEPFGALDAQTRYMMEQELARIWKQEKRTVVFITNNIEEAVYLADRIILMGNCPSRIKREYVIDLPRPRMYTDSAFLKIRKEISAAMDVTL